jgi:hypothetical protein
MPDTAQEREQRDEAKMLAGIAGHTPRQIADEHDLSIEVARPVSNTAANRHVAEVVAHMCATQADNPLLTLVIPDASEPDQTAAVRYVDWLLGQLERVDVRARVHYRPTAEGHVVFALEDESVNTQGGPGRASAPLPGAEGDLRRHAGRRRAGRARRPHSARRGTNCVRAVFRARTYLLRRNSTVSGMDLRRYRMRIA